MNDVEHRNYRRIMMLVARGQLKVTDDTGNAQTAQVDFGPHGSSGSLNLQDATPVIGLWGLAGNPPVDTDMLAISLGGDRNKSVVIGHSHQQHRLKNLGVGDAALYDVRGAYMWWQPAGLVVDAAGGNITVQNVDNITITNSGNVSLTTSGNVTATVSGDVTGNVTGNVTITHAANISATTSGNATLTATGNVSVSAASATVNATGNITVTAARTTINGPLTVNGAITAVGNVGITGAVTASGDVKAGSISLETHVHGGVTTGSGNTATPH
ncbi:MAG: phage baseplate assembly protein [Caulobacteraceae bacterium]|nr:phage baseplate assembly protein [Caulobacteraceae bacterium]